MTSQARIRIVGKAAAVSGLLTGAAILWGCVAGGGFASGGGARPEFAEPLRAEADGSVVRIRFAVRQTTDVAVLIRGPDGAPVRHLAAGALGGNAPSPLAANRLVQELEWDRTDDAGRPVPGGRYRVEVGLGLGTGEVRPFGWSPESLGRVHGLAVGPDGSLVTLSEGDFGFCRIQTFDARGRYARTLVPRSARLPLARVAPIGELVLHDGRRLPRELLPEYGGDSTQAPLVMPNGDLVFVNGPARAHPEGHRYRSSERGQQPVRRLLRLAPDGGASRFGYLGPVLGKEFAAGDLSLALGRDGQTIFVSGARHAVFRVTWGRDDPPAVVAGTPDKPGGLDNLNDPRGIAFDGEGNLYVADRGNHRVAVFAPDGRLAAQMPIEWPRQVLVHPPTGAIYVVSGYRDCFLTAHSSIRDRRPSLTLDLCSRDAILALDSRGSQPVLYAANVRATDNAGRTVFPALVRLVDTGDALRKDATLAAGVPIRPFLLGADRANERVYAFPQAGIAGGYARYDGRTGRAEGVAAPVHPKANQVGEATVGPDGAVAFHVRREFGRLDARLYPAPFAAVGTPIAILPEEDPPRSHYDRGCAMAPNGDLYWIHERGGYAQPMRCSALNADGTLKKDTLIAFESGSPASIHVDREGCVYVLDHLKPLGLCVPPEMGWLVPEGRRDDRFVYNYGSLLKFGPAGGSVKMLSKEPGAGRQASPDPTRFTTGSGQGLFQAEGLRWSWFGASMIQPALDRSATDPYACQCWAPRFDLDDFGRAFVPDQLQCAVQVLDSNGNPLLRFGRYGNADDPGPALADPRTVMVTDEAAYIGDVANQRILCVTLGYGARASVGVTVTGPPRSADRDRVEDYRPLARDPVRIAALWSLWRAPRGERDRAQLREALVDPLPLARVVAAYVLLDLGDPSGLTEVFKAARSPDPDVYKLAETAVLQEVVQWDAAHPLARLIDPKAPLAARFPIGPAEVAALIPLLDSPEWYLNRAAILLLGQSGRPEAAQAILERLRAGAFQDRNLNRALGALGALRCREAVPDLVRYVARGRAPNFGTESYNGDEAEKYAAAALGRIADPASVAPLIALLDSDKTGTPAEALWALSTVFDASIPDGERLLPRGKDLARVRLDELPSRKEVRSAWESFWKLTGGRYAPAKK